MKMAQGTEDHPSSSNGYLSYGTTHLPFFSKSLLYHIRFALGGLSRQEASNHLAKSSASYRQASKQVTKLFRKESRNKKPTHLLD